MASIFTKPVGSKQVWTETEKLALELEMAYKTSYPSYYKDLIYSNGNLCCVEIWNSTQTTRLFTKTLSYDVSGNLTEIEIVRASDSGTLIKRLFYEIDGDLDYITVSAGILDGTDWTTGLTAYADSRFGAWNPDDKHSDFVLYNNEKSLRNRIGSNWRSARSKISKNSGKWYWETKITNAPTNYQMAGTGKSTVPITNYQGADANGYGYSGYNGYKFNSASSSSYGNSFTLNDIVGVALDLDNGKIWFSKNDQWQASGDPVAGTNEAFSGLSGEYYPMHSAFSAEQRSTSYFYADELNYSPPSGYTAIGGFSKGLANDDNTSTQWASTSAGWPHWWAVELDDALKIVRINLYQDTNDYASTVLIQGSNNSTDGSDGDWNTIYTATGLGGGSSEEITFTNINSYLWYRLLANSGNDARYWIINEIEMYITYA